MENGSAETDDRFSLVVGGPFHRALRWIWRFLVWSGLLYRISRLSMQLMPLHPDRSGGLGFLANSPVVVLRFRWLSTH